METMHLRASSGREPSALPMLLGAIRAAGCWADETHASGTAAEVRVEMPLRAAVEFYGALIAWGLDLAKDSHLLMSGLCTQRLHQRRGFHPLRLRHPVQMLLVLRFEREQAWDTEWFGLA